MKHVPLGILHKNIQWWCMLWHGNVFCITGSLWGESTGFPSQGLVMQGLGDFFVVSLGEVFNKQSHFASEMRCLKTYVFSTMMWRHCKAHNVLVCDFMTWIFSLNPNTLKTIKPTDSLSLEALNAMQLTFINSRNYKYSCDICMSVKY